MSDREWARKIVDAAWNAATESNAVPSTMWADRIIDSVPLNKSDGCGERKEVASQLRDIARRIGVAASPEWVREELTKLANQLDRNTEPDHE